MSLSKMMSHPFFWVWVVVIFFVVYLVGGVIFQLATGFTKTITVKSTYTRITGRKTWYMMTDTQNNIYRVGNLWWKLDFDEADLWANLQAGKRYQVQGYGFRVPAFSWYPVVNDMKMVA